MNTHLSLFTGIGGLDIAAEWAGFTTVGQCEWAGYPTKILEKHWPHVPRWRDICTLTGEDFFARTGLRTVDVLSGGFPCQPFSVAGQRRGKEDDRYLWPEMLRVIHEIQPTWVIGENVAGIVNMALDTVLSDLESEGYICRAFIVPAAGVSAPHKRDRVCILGYAKHNGPSAAKISRSAGKPSNDQPERENASSEFAGTSGSEDGADVGYPKSAGLQSGISQITAAIPGFAGSGDPEDVDNPNSGGRKRTPQSGVGGVAHGLPARLDGHWDIEPDIPRVAKGVKNRVPRLKALGNAVVPQQFYLFFKAIAGINKTTEE